MGKKNRKKQNYEPMPLYEMSGMPQQEDVILTEAEWRKYARKCQLASLCHTSTGRNRRLGYDSIAVDTISLRIRESI